MDRFTTRNAGLASSRSAPLFAKAAFAFAAIAMASVLAASITDFDLAGWIHKPASANVTAAGLTSFDDRFGSGAARNASVITYPSRPVARSLRADFDAEFNHIESLLIGKLRDGSGSSNPQASSTETASVPMPRSSPISAYE